MPLGFQDYVHFSPSLATTFNHPVKHSTLHQVVVNPTAASALAALALGEHAVLDFVAPNDVDKPLLVLVRIKFVSDRGHVELEHVGNKQPDLSVVVVPDELLGLRAVCDQVHIDCSVATL